MRRKWLFLKPITTLKAKNTNETQTLAPGVLRETFVSFVVKLCTMCV